ncbi:unnamed protein product [Amoebophrya sp. A120]|nr:unnamed protein product [Amoebophrya sp. A120]|eukprot:GSA120T00001505001.1
MLITMLPARRLCAILLAVDTISLRPVGAFRTRSSPNNARRQSRISQLGAPPGESEDAPLESPTRPSSGVLQQEAPTAESVSSSKPQAKLQASALAPAAPPRWASMSDSSSSSPAVDARRGRCASATATVPGVENSVSSGCPTITEQVAMPEIIGAASLAGGGDQHVSLRVESEAVSVRELRAVFEQTATPGGYNSALSSSTGSIRGSAPGAGRSYAQVVARKSATGNQQQQKDAPLPQHCQQSTTSASSSSRLSSGRLSAAVGNNYKPPGGTTRVRAQSVPSSATPTGAVPIMKKARVDGRFEGMNLNGVEEFQLHNDLFEKFQKRSTLERTSTSCSSQERGKNIMEDTAPSTTFAGGVMEVSDHLANGELRDRDEELPGEDVLEENEDAMEQTGNGSRSRSRDDEDDYSSSSEQRSSRPTTRPRTYSAPSALKGSSSLSSSSCAKPVSSQQQQAKNRKARVRWKLKKKADNFLSNGSSGQQSQNNSGSELFVAHQRTTGSGCSSATSRSSGSLLGGVSFSASQKTSSSTSSRDYNNHDPLYYSSWGPSSAASFTSATSTSHYSKRRSRGTPVAGKPPTAKDPATYEDEDHMWKPVRLGTPGATPVAKPPCKKLRPFSSPKATCSDEDGAESRRRLILGLCEVVKESVRTPKSCSDAKPVLPRFFPHENDDCAMGGCTSTSGAWNRPRGDGQEKQPFARSFAQVVAGSSSRGSRDHAGSTASGSAGGAVGAPPAAAAHDPSYSTFYTSSCAPQYYDQQQAYGYGYGYDSAYYSNYLPNLQTPTPFRAATASCPLLTAGTYFPQAPPPSPGEDWAGRDESCSGPGSTPGVSVAPITENQNMELPINVQGFQRQRSPCLTIVTDLSSCDGSPASAAAFLSSRFQDVSARSSTVRGREPLADLASCMEAETEAAVENNDYSGPVQEQGGQSSGSRNKQAPNSTRGQYYHTQRPKTPRASDRLVDRPSTAPGRASSSGRTPPGLFTPLSAQAEPFRPMLRTPLNPRAQPFNPASSASSSVAPSSSAEAVVESVVAPAGKIRDKPVSASTALGPVVKKRDDDEMEMDDHDDAVGRTAEEIEANSHSPAVAPQLSVPASGNTSTTYSYSGSFPGMDVGGLLGTGSDRGLPLYQLPTSDDAMFVPMPESNTGYAYGENQHWY